MESKRNSSWKIAAMIVAIIAGNVGFHANALANSAADTDQETSSTFEYGPRSFSALVRSVKPAVVNISISGRVPAQQHFGNQQFPQDSPFNEFFQEHFGNRPQPGGGDREFRAVGSGFIIEAGGLVVTNNHVIENAEKIDIVMQDGTRYSASVQGRDPKTDLALLKVDTDVDLPFVELGSSDSAQVGDWVLAVGNPFGLGGSVTAGIISARGRDIQAGPFDDYLQIDAPINRGNSGGPLFDDRGRVIGINTAIYSPSGGSVGIGFAIPSSMASDIISQLKLAGTVERGWLGVEFQPVSEAVAASLGLDDAWGALVAGVAKDGPADRAGLKIGDVIISLDGELLQDPKDLPRLVAGTRAGTEVDIEVWRGGKKRSLEVEIGRSEVSAELAGGPASSTAPARLGLQLSELTSEVRERYGVSGSDGVLVTDVQRNSPASKAGIRPGHVITMVGQTTVDSPNDLVDEVEKAAEDGRPSVLLMVEQGDERRFVAVELAV